MKKNFKLKGLDCANCAVKIEEKVNLLLNIKIELNLFKIVIHKQLKIEE